MRREFEDQLRRQFGSQAAREANKRRLERGVRAVGRRLRNAAIAFVAMLLLIIAGISTGVLGWITAPLALIATFIISVLVLFWPSSGRGQGHDLGPVIDATAAHRLDRLASQTEDWLVQRARGLPHEAAPALDRIVARLRELEPALAGTSSDTSDGGEAQRLIGQHLPGLVNTWLGLPPQQRAPGSDHSRRLADSLAIVADELDHLCEKVGCERIASFDVERRFIETRYRDGDGLSLDKRP
ncbi:hypothetical protein [Sphingosinicella sp. YJ22]|uniref:hypothetical protein n=1 Tax=Sphingosinicella sp. YJ22 TaxID=1104780 RepID=UPI00140E57FF|nr:hypothetical protein [Sphingosinicella sp. YJ22]